MIALVEAIHAGLFSKKNILPNILAGIVVGIVTIPLSMAFAIASNVAPEVGLYTSIIAVFCGSIFGGSRVQISGPTGAFIGVLLSISSQFGFDGLQLATIMAGCILIFMGFTHCGEMIKFIPEQVIIGFTTGIAINLLIGQIPNFFGLTCGKLSVSFLEKLSQIFQSLSSINFETTLISTISLLVLIFNKKTPLKIVPGPVMALICGVILQYIFRFNSVDTIGSAFGGIPKSFPILQFPTNISPIRIISLLSSAFAIAMLGAIESLLSAVIADRIMNTKHSSNQELIGQGIANIMCPLFGGIASTGSIARTASNIRTGGNSPLAGIVSSIILILIICFCAPLATNIPLATLAAIIFMVAYKMMGLKTFYILLKHAPRLDAITLIITCVLTIVCGIVFAVNIGIVLSALVFMYRMSDSTEINQEKEKNNDETPLLPSDIAVYTISGPFFFGMLDKFEITIDHMQPNIKILILSMKNVPFIDTSGLQTLEALINKFEQSSRKIIISEAQPKVVQKLRRAQIYDSIHKEIDNISLSDAINIAKKYHHEMLSKQ